MHLTEVLLRPEKYPTDESYPFNLRIFSLTKGICLDAPVTFFVGENGTGKSTLLEAICRRCGIHIWEGQNRSRVEVNPYEKTFYRAVKVRWRQGTVPGSFFSSDLFRNFSKLADEWAASDPSLLNYIGGKSLMTLSHGQSLMTWFRYRFRIKGLYLLDEPETALSPKSQLELLNLLQETSCAGQAQFVIATHSPILMACPGAKILNFDDAPIRKIDYEKTDHYKIYRDFMINRADFLTIDFQKKILARQSEEDA
jgi:predicted ATPase